MRKLIITIFTAIIIMAGACKKKISIPKGPDIPPAYLNWLDKEPPRVWPAYLNVPFRAGEKIYLYTHEPAQIYYSFEKANPGLKGKKAEGGIPIPNLPNGGTLFVTAIDLKGNQTHTSIDLATGEKSLFEIRFPGYSPIQGNSYPLYIRSLGSTKERGEGVLKLSDNASVKISSGQDTDEIEIKLPSKELTLSYSGKGTIQLKVPVFSETEAPRFAATHGNMLFAPFYFEGECVLREGNIETPFVLNHYPVSDKVQIRCESKYGKKFAPTTVSFRQRNPHFEVTEDKGSYRIQSLEKSGKFQSVEVFDNANKKWVSLPENYLVSEPAVLYLRYKVANEPKNLYYMQLYPGLEKMKLGATGLEEPTVQSWEIKREAIEEIPKGDRNRIILKRIAWHKPLSKSLAKKKTPVAAIMAKTISDIDLRSTVLEDLHNLGEDLANFEQIKNPKEVFSILLGIGDGKPLLNGKELVKNLVRYSPEFKNRTIAFSRVFPRTSGLKKAIPVITEVKPGAIFPGNFSLMALLSGKKPFLSNDTSKLPSALAGFYGIIADAPAPRSLNLSGAFTVRFDEKAPRAPARIPTADFRGDADLWKSDNSIFDKIVLITAREQYSNRQPMVREYKSGIPLAKITISRGGWVKIQSFGSIRAPEAGFYLHDMVTLTIQKWLYQQGLAGKSIRIPFENLKVKISSTDLKNSFGKYTRGKNASTWFRKISAAVPVTYVKSGGNYISDQKETNSASTDSVWEYQRLESAGPETGSFYILPSGFNRVRYLQKKEEEAKTP